jgi:excisionase family DNA binding protein
MTTGVAVKTKNQIGGMLRTGEACRILYVSGNTLRRWNKIGIINAYRVGPRGDRRFRLEDVNALLAQEIRLNSGFGVK